MASDVVTKSGEPPRRIPKLAVKNRIPEDEAITRPLSEEYQQPPSRFSVASSALEPPRSPPPKSSFASDGPTLINTTTASLDGRDTKSTASSKKNKVFSFFALKEPSAKAWEEFAEAEKEKAKQTGVRNFSSQKLPAHVPKVNSKWDGLPESARQRLELEKAKKNGLVSTSSRVGTSYSKDEWAEESGLPFTIRLKGSSSEEERDRSTIELDSQARGPSPLETVHELPAISDTALGEIDGQEVAELDTSSSNVISASSASHTIPPRDLDSTLPGLTEVDEPGLASPMEEGESPNEDEDEEPPPALPRKSSKRPKVPVNFSRPMRRQTGDSIGYPSAERAQDT